VTEYAPYETLFTVVQWDQRGAGRTYGRYGDDTPDLTLEQLVSDGIELSHYLKEHLSDPDIILLGHSWGSVIGVEMAEREPDLFTAYVGTGQVASWDSGVRYQYELVRSKANEPGNQAMLDVLEEIGEFDPTDVQDFLAVNRFLRQYLGPADADWLDGIGARTAQAVSPDIANAIGGGMNLSGRTLFSTQIREDLVSTANSFEIPFIVIQGEEDLFTPTPVAVQYFDAVSAPRKEMRIISGAGHFALVTHTEEFVAVITEAVIRNRD
jgi:pimeloyl-ACP methyl ester carboxylesterase